MSNRSRRSGRAPRWLAHIVCCALVSVACGGNDVDRDPAVESGASAARAASSSPDAKSWRGRVAELNVAPLDVSHSYVGFSVQHVELFRVRGRFEEFAGTILLDEDDIRNSSISVVVQTASIDTGNDMRDADLRRSYYFDVENHPVARFQSTTIEPIADGLIARGVLEIKGIAREIAVEFQRAGEYLDPELGDRRIFFEGSASLERSDFDLVYEGNVLEESGFIGGTAELVLELQGVVRNPLTRDYPGGDDAIGSELERIVRAGSVEAAINRYREVAGEGPIDGAERQLQHLGLRQLAEGRAEAAAAIFAVQVEDFPNSGAAHRLRALAALAAGDGDQPAGSLRSAILLDPDDTTAIEILRRLEAAPFAVWWPESPDGG